MCDLAFLFYFLLSHFDLIWRKENFRDDSSGKKRCREIKKRDRDRESQARFSCKMINAIAATFQNKKKVNVQCTHIQGKVPEGISL